MIPLANTLLKHQLQYFGGPEFQLPKKEIDIQVKPIGVERFGSAQSRLLVNAPTVKTQCLFIPKNSSNGIVTDSADNSLAKYKNRIKHD